MEKICGNYLIFLIFLISGCSVNGSATTKTPIPPSTEVVLSPTATTMPTSTPTATYTSTPTFTPTPDYGYQQNCLTVENAIPHGFLSEGSIIYIKPNEVSGRDSLFAFDTKENQTRTLSERGTFSEIVSPDGKWLARSINTDSNDPYTYFLEILSADGQVRSEFRKADDWGTGPLYWLGNEWVAYDYLQDHETFVDIFTGQTVSQDYSFGEFSVAEWNTPVYDPLFTRVVFQRDRLGEPQSTVLRDVARGLDIWRRETGRVTDVVTPQWTQDGSRFVVSIPPEVNANNTQLFIVDRNGNAEQVTHINQSGTFLYLPVWSPDEHYVAFWRWNVQGTSLAVYDLRTGLVSDYCLTPFSSTAGLYWSPDSRQIVFNLDIELPSGVSPIVVVDVEEKRAVKLMDGVTVLGWMTLLP